MKTPLKFILIIGLLFSFASCKEEDRLKIDSELEITNSTVLKINEEEVSQADFPGASISFEQLKNSSVIATLKNLVLGHPEVPIICTYTVVRSLSGSEKISFNGSGIYADIMSINVNGVIDKHNVDSLNISTEYDYDIVGKWKPEQIIMTFSHPEISTDAIGRFASFINDIIRKEKIFDDDDLILTLTEDGYIGQHKIVQYHIDNIAKLFYIYVRHTYTQEIIDKLDDSLKNILDSLQLYDAIKNLANIEFSFKYESDGNNLTLYVDEETMKPCMAMMPESFIDFISELQFDQITAEFPEIKDELAALGIFLNKDIFESFKAYVIKLLDLLADPETEYQIGTKFGRIS